MFTEAQLPKSKEATSNTIVTWFFMGLVDAKFRGRRQILWNGADRRRFNGCYKSSVRYEHQKLGVIGQVVDERLAMWSPVGLSVTKNFL